jgi:hypothetical protein
MSVLWEMNGYSHHMVLCDCNRHHPQKLHDEPISYHKESCCLPELAALAIHLFTCVHLPEPVLDDHPSEKWEMASTSVVTILETDQHFVPIDNEYERADVLWTLS